MPKMHTPTEASPPFSKAQWAALERSSATPERIVLGRVGVTEKTAWMFVKAGLWERTAQELCRGKHYWRYRLTAAARAALAAASPADTE